MKYFAAVMAVLAFALTISGAISEFYYGHPVLSNGASFINGLCFGVCVYVFCKRAIDTDKK